MFSKKYLVKKKLIEILVKNGQNSESAKRKWAENISRQLILVTNKKFSPFIPVF